MMLKLVLAASAVALASVMAISAGPAHAQSICPTARDILDGPTWGMMRPPCDERSVDSGEARYVNYAGDPIVVGPGPYDEPRYVNYGGDIIVAPARRPRASDFIDGPTWGMMRPPGF